MDGKIDVRLICRVTHKFIIKANRCPAHAERIGKTGENPARSRRCIGGVPLTYQPLHTREGKAVQRVPSQNTCLLAFINT